MATIATRLTSSGTYFVNGNFDEVNGAVPTNGLVLQLDAGQLESYSPASTSTWRDLSSYRNNLSLVSNVAAYDSSAESINFNNVAYATTSSNSLNGLVTNSTDFSVSVWFNFNSTASYTAIFEKQASVGGGVARMDIGYGANVFYWTGWNHLTTTVNDLTFTTPIAAGTWYHTVLTCTGSTKTAYINGTSVATAAVPTSWPDATNPIAVSGKLRPLNGRIAAAQVYNRALTATEVQQLYNATAPRFKYAKLAAPAVSASRVTTSTVYAPAFDEVIYNATSGVTVGNSFAHSQSFTSTVWTPGNATLSLNTTTVAAPDGTFTAAKLIDVAGLGQHTLGYTPGFTFNTGSVYTYSIYVKAAEISSIGVYLPGGNSGAKYNVSTGALIANDAGINSSITPYPNGWWRISATYTSLLTTVQSPTLYMMAPSTSYTAVGGQGLYIWGPQYEIGATTASIYVPTIANAVPAPGFSKRETSSTVYIGGILDEITGAPVVDNSLVLWLDAAQPASYPGSGSTWTSIASISTSTSLFTSTFTTLNGGAIQFDGVSTYADLAVPNLASASTCTVEVYCKPYVLNARMFFGFIGYDVYTNGGTISYNTGASDGYGIGTTATTALGILGTWTHFSFVMQNNTSLASNPYTNNKIYVNGVNQPLVQSFTTQSGTTRTFGTGLMRLSGWLNDNNYRTQMDLAVFKVYNRELTADEIQQNYNATKRRFT